MRTSLHPFLSRLFALLGALLVVLPSHRVLATPTHIAAELVPERTAAAAGETVMLAFSMKPADGWHGYWENPGYAGLWLEPTWSLPPGAKAGALSYPVPRTLLVAGLM